MVPTVRLIRSLGVALIAAALLAACTSDSGAEGAADATTSSTSSTSTSTTSSTTTSEPPAPTTTEDPQAAFEREVFEGFLDAIDAAGVAFDPPDPDHPRIRATHTSVMLDQRITALRSRLEEGRAVRYHPDSVRREEVVPGTMQINGDTAVFQLCATDDGVTVDVDSGALDGPGPVTTYLQTIGMAREDGVWKLAELRFDDRWEGVAGCAEDWE